MLPNTILYILLGIPVFMYFMIATMWPLYLAGMNLKRNKDKLTWETKIIAYPLFVFGLFWDMIFNFTYGTIIYIEIPKELLFTARCERHLKTKSFRGKIAHWHCSKWLNPFDPDGTHC